MVSQAEKAARLSKLHQKGNPLVLYNIWDAGGAKALEDAGAPAVATGSWSVAAAHGYTDGEAIPLDLVLRIVERIYASIEVPMSVDFEGAYAVDPQEAAENVRKIIRAGAAGINFEDRIVNGEGLHPIAAQAERIRAIKAVATEEGIPIVLNARTDLFLGTDPATHRDKLAEAREREVAYAQAGADCFFVPGLTEAKLIAEVVETAHLPVNVLMRGDLTTVENVAALGVSRISYGPSPYAQFVQDLHKAYADVV